MTRVVPPPKPKSTRTVPLSLPRKRASSLGVQKRNTAAILRKQEESVQKTRAKLEDLKNAKKVINHESVFLSPEELERPNVSAVVQQENAQIIFKPNEGPQSLFLSASEQEVLYGGAAGGGKTMGMIADALRDTPNGAFRGLIIRRTMDELREIKQKTLELYKQVYPSCHWSEKSSEWTFPSGSKLWLTYLERDADVQRYQGQAFTYIGVDELTQYSTPYAWDYLRSRLRTADPKLKVYQRATTNPGGPGHVWVKKMFIDPAPWGEAFWATNIETGEPICFPINHKIEELRGKLAFKRRFIPGKLQDNPYLYEDGRYEANLLSMPEHQRKQLLDGSWDVVEGAAFGEWDRTIHVVKRQAIPSSWRKFRSADYGYTAHGACVWFAIRPDNQLIIYREMYERGLNAAQFARKVLELEKDDKITYGIIDSSVFHHKGDIGVSIAEQMANEGCFWRPSDRSKGSRKNGKNEFHRRLQVNELTGEPGLVIMENCVNLIAQIPLLQLDKNDPEDVDTKGEDHLYDAARYGIMSRPTPNITDYMIIQRPDIKEIYMPTDTVFGY